MNSLVTTDGQGRRMLRIEARNAAVPSEPKPEWMRTRIKTGPQFTEIQALVTSEGLHPVCQEAGCPNIYECWEDREATFLIGGEQCTRRCDFCHRCRPTSPARPRGAGANGRVRVHDERRCATVPGVAREDLPDVGAGLWAETVHQIHELNVGTVVEVPIPSFLGHAIAAGVCSDDH